jgi:chromosome partitioning protein
VLTSGLVHTGLGWPTYGPADDHAPSGHLGWPGPQHSRVHDPVQEPGDTVRDNHRTDPVHNPVHEPERGAKAQPEDGIEGDDAPSETPSTDPVSRETRTSAGAKHMSERDQLAASLPEPGAETPLAQAVAVDARRRITLTGKIFPKPDHTRILTVANQKGGVGKTTTTVNVAAALAQAGLRVLVVDIDPQGNASTALGIDHHADVPSIYDVLVDGKAIVDVVQECVDVPNLWCVPATIDLAGAEIELVSLVARETRMERALSAYLADAADRGEERLDYVLIDCPPSLGLLTVNAFVAADEVFIPIQCEYYALEGLSQLLKNVELIKRHLNPGLHVSTILLTMYDARTRLSAQVADEVRTHFPAHVLRTTVPRSVRISEAPSHGQTVMTYDPSSSGALSYLEAASELADRGAAG